MINGSRGSCTKKHDTVTVTSSRLRTGRCALANCHPPARRWRKRSEIWLALVATGCTSPHARTTAKKLTALK